MHTSHPGYVHALLTANVKKVSGEFLTYSSASPSPPVLVSIVSERTVKQKAFCSIFWSISPDKEIKKEKKPKKIKLIPWGKKTAKYLVDSQSVNHVEQKLLSTKGKNI